MSNNIEGRGVQIFLAFLAGAATGAVAALLTAPRTGKETRERLGTALRQAREKASRMPSALGEIYDRAAEAARGTFVKSLEKESPSPEVTHTSHTEH